MRAKDEAIELDLRQLRRRLLNHGDRDGLLLAEQQGDVHVLRSHYLLRLMDALNEVGTGNAGRGPCQKPGCSHDVISAAEGDPQLCDAHMDEAEKIIMQKNAKWTRGTQFFRLAAGGLITCWKQENQICMVCKVRVERWEFNADWCSCDRHSQMMIKQIRADSFGVVMTWDHPAIGDFAGGALGQCQTDWARAMKKCACCGRDAGAENVSVTYGPTDQDCPKDATWRSMGLCSWCRAACEQLVRQRCPAALTGDLDVEWQAVLAAGEQLAQQEASLDGWLPGQRWGTAQPAPQAATEGFTTPTKADVSRLLFDEAGKVSKSITKAEKEAAEWHYRSQSPLLNDRWAVQKRKIEQRGSLSQQHRRRLMDNFESAELDVIDEALAETGERGINLGAQLRWRSNYAPQMTNRIELERMRELEMAEWIIGKLVKIVEGDADTESIFTEDMVLDLSDKIVQRIRWGQNCVARLTTKDTTFGGLKARKTAITNMNAGMRVGRKQTRTVAQIREKELEAADKAELEHIKNTRTIRGGRRLVRRGWC